jgi:hypothetical protein
MHFPQAHRIRRQVSVGPKRDKYFAVPIVNQVISSYSRVCSPSLPSDSDTRDRGLVTDARQDTFDASFTTVSRPSHYLPSRFVRRLRRPKTRRDVPGTVCSTIEVGRSGKACQLKYLPTAALGQCLGGFSY